MPTLTRAYFMSAMNHGKTMTVEDQEGDVHTITKSEDKLGYYKVDDKRNHTLEGIFVWFGHYHIDYGAAVVSGKIE